MQISAEILVKKVHEGKAEVQGLDCGETGRLQVSGIK